MKNRTRRKQARRQQRERRRASVKIAGHHEQWSLLATLARCVEDGSATVIVIQPPESST